MKRAMVTGGARRIGAAFVAALEVDGWAVAVHHNGSDAGSLGMAQIRADLSAEGEVATLINRAADALNGPLDLLINNAAAFDHDMLATMTRDSWDRHLEVNLRAPVHLTQLFAAQARTGAQVINILDQRVAKLTPHFMSYTLAKAALGTFTVTAAQALAPDIRVNAIAPGPTLVGARESDAHFARQRAGTLLGAGSDVEDVIAALRYLLIARATTGQTLFVDGGQNLAWQTPDIEARK